MTSQKMPPGAGQKWNITSLIKEKQSFATLIGDYEASELTPAMDEFSIHFYRLAENEEDKQRPHHEPEAYYVLEGERILKINHEGRELEVNVSTGDLVYVPAKARHRFHGKS